MLRTGTQACRSGVSSRRLPVCHIDLHFNSVIVLQSALVLCSEVGHCVVARFIRIDCEVATDSGGDLVSAHAVAFVGCDTTCTPRWHNYAMKQPPHIHSPACSNASRQSLCRTHAAIFNDSERPQASSIGSNSTPESSSEDLLPCCQEQPA